MKYVINTCYGGFGINKEWVKTHGYKYDFEVSRTDENLINDIENGINLNDYCSNLKIVEIPSEATDWELIEFDRLEEIIAVVNGKIVHI